MKRLDGTGISSLEKENLPLRAISRISGVGGWTCFMYGFRGHRLGPKSGNYKEVNFRPPGELETTQGVTGEGTDEWGAQGVSHPWKG